MHSGLQGPPQETQWRTLIRETPQAPHPHLSLAFVMQAQALKELAFESTAGAPPRAPGSDSRAGSYWLREDFNFQEFCQMVDVTWMARNQPWWESLNHVNWQILQISSTSAGQLLNIYQEHRGQLKNSGPGFPEAQERGPGFPYHCPHCLSSCASGHVCYLRERLSCKPFPEKRCHLDPKNEFSAWRGWPSLAVGPAHCHSSRDAQPRHR